MKKISLITLFLFLFNFLSSQNDDRANSLLEEVSKKIDSAASYSINFTYSLENISEDIKQESNGKIIIEKDNYLLEFME
jgi:outer membrane lipoprotein-sorting protein